MRTVWQALNVSPRRTLLDLVWLGVGALVICVVSFALGIPFRINAGAVALGFGSGEIGFVLGVLTLAAALFVIRLWRTTLQIERRYRRMFDNAIEGVFQSSPDGRYLYMNRAHAQIFGYASPEEMIAAIQNIAQQTYVDASRRDDFMRELERTGEVRNFENRAYRRDGSIVWVLANARAERDARGKILYIEGNVQDITARKETETAYHHLVEQSLLGIVIHQNNRTVFANRAFAEMLGYDVAEVTNLPPEQDGLLIHPDDRAVMRQRAQDRLAGKTVPARYVFQALKRDGTVCWLETNAALIEHHGAPAILMLMVDVTARKLAQDKMQENMQRAQLREQLSVTLARAGNELDAVLNTVTRVMVSALGQSSAILLVNENGKYLKPVAYHHANARLVKRVCARWEGVHIPLVENMYAHAIQTGEALLRERVESTELEQLGGNDFARFLKYFGAFSLLVIPLRVQNKTLGVLLVTRHEPEPAFQLNDSHFAQEIADRAALAIANAQLFQQLQRELNVRGQVETRYRTLVEQIPAVTYIASGERLGETLYVSPQIEMYLGFTPAEWTAVPDFWASRLHPDDRGWVLQSAARARHARLPFHAEYRLLARDRAVHWIRDEAVLVFNVQGHPLYQHGIMLDITSHKTLEAKYTQAIQDADAERAVMQRELETLRAQLPTREYTPTSDAALAHASRAAMETAEGEQRAFARALSEAAALLNRATDAHQVLDGILDTVNKIVPYETASIFLRQGDKLVLARSRGFEKYNLTEWIRGVSFPVDFSKFQTLTGEGRPIVIPETRGHADWILIPETDWIRSHVSVPVRIGGETVGMLGLDSATPNFYNAEHGARLVAFADLAAAALRNAQLLEETQQRAQQLALLYDVGLTLNRVLEERTQLDFLFKIARRALRADRMAFFRYDAASDMLLYEVGIGVPERLEPQLRVRPYHVNPPEGLIGWVAHNRVPALAPDVARDEHWVAIEGIVKSALAVPVEHENELRGVLLASSHHLNAFTAQDERMLTLFANQIAAAMELTRLFKVQAQRAHELEILREASLAFAVAPDRAALTNLILQFALRLAPAHNAFLFFYHGDGFELGGSLWADNSGIEPQIFMPRRGGLTDTVARTGEIIVVNDVNTHPLFSNWQWGGSIVSLPLKGGGQVRAVLNVAFEKPRPFTRQEIHALELFADQAAVALENERHVEEIRRQLRDAQLLHRAGEALNQSLAFDATIRQLADFFIQATQVQVCTISRVELDKGELRVLVDHDPIAALRVEPGAVYRLSDYPYLLAMLETKRSRAYRRDDSTLDAITAENMDQFQWLSMLVTPLFAGSEIIGLVELADRTTCRDFLPETIRLAESLAHQASSALENVRLFQETQRRAEQLTVLNRIARHVNSAATLDEMILIIESETARVLPSDTSFIALYDAATEMVDFHRVVDYGEVRPPFQFRLGPSLTREVITTARALRLDDRKDYPSVENPPQYYGDGSMLRAWLGAPIRSGDRVVGVISVQSKQRAAFSQADEQLLQTIADQVGPALERAAQSK